MSLSDLKILFFPFSVVQIWRSLAALNHNTSNINGKIFIADQQQKN